MPWACAVQASDHLKELYARISFLRMTTPRLPRDRHFRGGAGTFIVRDGALVPGEARKESRCRPRQRTCFVTCLPTVQIARMKGHRLGVVSARGALLLVTPVSKLLRPASMTL